MKYDIWAIWAVSDFCDVCLSGETNVWYRRVTCSGKCPRTWTRCLGNSLISRHGFANRWVAVRLWLLRSLNHQPAPRRVLTRESDWRYYRKSVLHLCRIPQAKLWTYSTTQGFEKRWFRPVWVHLSIPHFLFLNMVAIVLYQARWCLINKPFRFN